MPLPTPQSCPRGQVPADPGCCSIVTATSSDRKINEVCIRLCGAHVASELHLENDEGQSRDTGLQQNPSSSTGPPPPASLDDAGCHNHHDPNHKQLSHEALRESPRLEPRVKSPRLSNQTPPRLTSLTSTLYQDNTSTHEGLQRCSSSPGPLFNPRSKDNVWFLLVTILVATTPFHQHSDFRWPVLPHMKY